MTEKRIVRMNVIARPALAVALVTLLLACGGDGSSENRAAPVTNDQSAMANSMTADPSNPYAQAEMQMHERMMAAVGTDVSDTWVKKMIEHHRGAVEMSNVVLGQGAEGRVREIAQMIVAKQTKEIGELEAIAKQGNPSAEAGAAYRAGDTQMHDRMMAAKGGDASETWIRKMIEHHRGAIAMSQVAIAQGQDARVKEQARKTTSDQTKEIAELERLLSGEAAPAAAASAAPAAKAAPAAAAPKPAVRPVPKAGAEAPKASTPPQAAPQARPKAPAATPTCLPEHRALGHC